nr:hypothetical protein [Tanacetum cinerariifolium]
MEEVSQPDTIPTNDECLNGDNNMEEVLVHETTSNVIGSFDADKSTQSLKKYIGLNLSNEYIVVALFGVQLLSIEDLDVLTRKIENAVTIPIVMNNDGFQTVVNKKKSGKTCSTRFKTTWQPINQKVRFDPKSHGNPQKEKDGNIMHSVSKEKPSKAANVPSSFFSRGSAKNGGLQYSSSASNIHTSNPYDALDDIESDEEVELFRRKALHAKAFDQKFKAFSRECFSEYIRELISSLDKGSRSTKESYCSQICSQSTETASVDTIMSDSEDSTVTYTDAPPSPEFVPEPVFPKFMPLEDKILPAEEQPLPAVDLPTANLHDTFLSLILKRIQLIILSTKETMTMMMRRRRKFIIMSNTNNNMQTETSNTLHNAIMEAGSKDRPPMLAPDNDIYSTVNTFLNAWEIWKAIERLKQGESINVQDLETNLYWEFGKFTSQDGESLESYYSRFYKMMNELIRNQCKVTNHQVNVQFLLQLQPEWQRFVILVKKNQKLKTVSYHKLYDILKQHQHEVNKIRAEKITRVANPLALVAQQQPVYHPQTHPTHYTQNSSTRSLQDATRNRGKAIVNSPQPIYDQEPFMVAEDDETSQDKEIDKFMALISLSFKKIYKPTNNNLRTSSNTSRANQDNSPWINRSVGYENQRIGNVDGDRETVAYHREKMMLCKQEEAGIQLNAEQADWRDDTDDELEDQELEAHYMYMAQLQEVFPDDADSGPIFDDEPLQKVSNDDHYNVFAMESKHPEQSESVHDTYPIDQDTHNVIIDSLDMRYDREEIDQNDDDNDLAKERELLASLIQKLECEIDESKNRNKFLETSNKVLIEKLKGKLEDFKNKNKSLESSNNRFKEANNKLSETNNLLYTDYKKLEAELARRNSGEYASQMEIECAKVRGDFLSYKMEYQKSCTKYTQTINDLNQMISEMKDKLSAHQETC